MLQQSDQRHLSAIGADESDGTGLYKQTSDISALSGLTNLTYLDLDVAIRSAISQCYRGYESVVSVFGQQPDQRHLNPIRADESDGAGPDSNQISDVSVFSGLTNLTVAVFAHNQISDISALSGLTNLSYLDLRNNPLNVEAYCIYLPLIEDNNPGTNLRLRS